MLSFIFILFFLNYIYTLLCPSGSFYDNYTCYACPSNSYSNYHSSVCLLCSQSNFIQNSYNNILSRQRYDLSAQSASNIVIFAGGYDGGSQFFDNIDILNIDNNSWSTSALSNARTYMGSCGFINGILFAGGLATGTIFTYVDFYDVLSSNWIVYSNGLSVGRYDLACIALGYVGLCGGGQGSTPSNVVDYFNSSSKIWRSSSDLSVARSALAAATCGNYAVFAGGRITGVTRKSTVDIFSFEDNNWTNLAAGLSISRDHLVSTSIGSVCLFAGGQITVTADSSDRVDIFNSTDASWITYSLSYPRYALSASTSGCKAVFIGGYDGTTIFSIIDIFDSNNNIWSTAQLSTPRYNFASSSFNGHIVIGGGAYISLLNSVEYLSSCPIGGISLFVVKVIIFSKLGRF